MKTRAAMTGLVLIIGLGVTGCGGEEKETKAKPSSTPSASATVNDGNDSQWATPKQTPSPEPGSESAGPAVTAVPSKGSFGNNPQAPDQDPAPTKTLSGGEQAQAEAKKEAVTVMGLYARPDESASGWRKDIRSHLTEQANRDFQDFDPSYLEVTGVKKDSARIEGDPNAQRVNVVVTATPKDQNFKVAMVHMPDGSWRADGIEPATLGQH